MKGTCDVEGIVMFGEGCLHLKPYSGIAIIIDGIVEECVIAHITYNEYINNRIMTIKMKYTKETS